HSYSFLSSFHRYPHHPDLPSFPTTTLFRSQLGIVHNVAATHGVLHFGERCERRFTQPSRLYAGCLSFAKVAKRARVTKERNYESDRKSTRLNSSHSQISYAVFCLKKKTKKK